MTKKMEDFFNIPSEVDEEESPQKTKEQLFAEVTEVSNALTTAEQVNLALPTVTDLNKHEAEMDDIARRAIKTFQDLIVLGGNVPDMHAGKIYEVGVSSLKLALDANNSKADRKLKMIELQIKKVRAEQIDFEQGNGNQKQINGGEFDRNELLRYIVSSKTANSDK
jgi:hypothetical protein